MMDVEIIPCSAEHLEKLIEGADAFQSAYGFEAINEYMPFEGALQHMLKEMQDLQVRHPWLPYLVVFRPDLALIGLCGFKSVPDAQREIEIGYSISPKYQNRGFATSAASQLIEIACKSQLVDCVFAHTLPEKNASTSVLTKCGMVKVSEAIEPDIGTVWRWETRAGKR
jgi:[ribosomal protein S5]-alanine N-acetyltransferase